MGNRRERAFFVAQCRAAGLGQKALGTGVAAVAFQLQRVGNLSVLGKWRAYWTCHYRAVG